MKDYTKFSNKKHEVEVAKVEEPVTTGFVQTEDVPEVETETKTAEPMKNGFVSGCKNLNVRERPDLFAAVVGQLRESTELVIDLEESTDDFYAVYTASGMEGYCMKKFITLVD